MFSVSLDLAFLVGLVVVYPPSMGQANQVCCMKRIFLLRIFDQAALGDCSCLCVPQ